MSESNAKVARTLRGRVVSDKMQKSKISPISIEELFVFMVKEAK